MEKKTLGTFLAALRKANGLTQKQLADKLNVSDKAVSRWERDESAPDLSLIPVIAEIFGVTSDELLRGERAVPGENPERAAEKTDKQLRRLLKDTLTKFRIHSSITLCIALVGLIAAMIGNTAFQRAYMGFLAACIFFVAALVCQVIFLILGDHALDQEEFDPVLTATCRKQLVLGSELMACVIAALFAACLPLTLVPDADCWVDDGWLEMGIFFALIAAALLAVIFLLLNLKLGYHRLPNFKTPLNRLRLRCAALFLALILVLGVGHVFLAAFLTANPQLLTDYTEFDNWADFKAFMETPMDADGPLTYVSADVQDGNICYTYEGRNGQLYQFESQYIWESIYANPDDAEPLVKYRNLNMSVERIETSDDADRLPVQVYDTDQYAWYNQLGELLLWCYALLYLAVAAGAVLFYRKRKKNL